VGGRAPLSADSLGVSHSDSYYLAFVNRVPLAPEVKTNLGREGTAFLGVAYGQSSFAPGRRTDRRRTLFGGLLLPLPRRLSAGVEIAEGHTAITLGGPLGPVELQLRWEHLSNLGCAANYCYWWNRRE